MHTNIYHSSQQNPYLYYINHFNPSHSTFSNLYQTTLWNNNTQEEIQHFGDSISNKKPDTIRIFSHNINNLPKKTQ